MDNNPHDVYTLKSETGKVKGYIRSDGAITDYAGRVKGYIE